MGYILVEVNNEKQAEKLPTDTIFHVILKRASATSSLLQLQLDGTKQ